MENVSSFWKIMEVLALAFFENQLPRMEKVNICDKYEEKYN